MSDEKTGTLFDIREGRRLRDEGRDRVERHDGSSWLVRARECAWRVAHERGSVTADDVRARMGEDQPHHPNLYGSIFRDPRFTFTGERRQSRAKSRHAGEQKVWRLTDLRRG